MTASLPLTSQTLLPSEQDASLALETSRRLAPHLSEKPLEIRVLQNGQDSETLELPSGVARLLLNVLQQMARGNAVTLIPIHAELTTQQAADLLNVSRPYLVQLLEDGQIPFRKVGTHRRVRFQDLAAFKEEKLASRRQSLQELVALDQELGFE